MPRYTGRSRLASLGTFSELGGEITYEWDPEPGEVAVQLMEVAGYLEDIEGPLLLSKQVLHDDIQMRFTTKIDPDGNAWAPWSDSYATYRENYYPEGGILVRTEDLKNAAASEEAYEVGPAGIFYNTQGLPEYWLWNQEGAERGGGVSESEAQALASHMGTTVEHAKSELAKEGNAGSNTLPARPFVGASYEAELQIAEIFDRWFDGAITLATSSKGKLFGRYSYRGPGGQFASRH